MPSELGRQTWASLGIGLATRRSRPLSRTATPAHTFARMAASPRLTGIKGGLALMDGLASALTGAGGSADRNIYRQYIQAMPVSAKEVESAYRTSALLRKIHDLPPQDMTREWRDWQAEKDDIAKIEAEEKRLGIRRKVREALKAARIYGGSALVLGTGDSNPSGRLPANLGAKGLKYINLLSRHALSFHDLDLDPLSEFFGQPKMWQVNGVNGQVEVHPSRVIPFIAQPIPKGIEGTQANNFWGDPLLEGIKNAAANSDSVLDGIAALVQEAKVDVYKIKDLMANVGTADYETRLMRRLQIAQQAKSIHNAVITDGEEEWEQKQLTFASLRDIAMLELVVLAGAADIPVTRLLGRSAEGMNATGEGDDKNYDRMIATKQEDELQPALERLDTVLLPSAGVSPDNASWTFAPLDEPTEKEKADISKIKAERTKIYVDLGILPKEAIATAVANELVEDQEYPGLDEALADAEAAGDIPPILEEPTEEELAAEAGLAQPPGASEGNAARKPRQSAKDAAPRTLYVRRNLVNAAEFIAWAKGQGFDTTTPAEDLHVTIAFSRQPVDWMKAGSAWAEDDKGQLKVPAGGARLVEPLGDKGAVVLLFTSSELSWRHEAIKRDADASWDFESYQPHVTITYSKPAGLDLKNVEPYRGKLIFGPEIFEEVVEDWEKNLKES